MRLRLFVTALLLVGSAAAHSATPPAAAVATAHPLATQAAIEILKSGGNAFDAAVAASAALAVVEPYSSGLGGGGFWLLHRASDGHEVMIDGREQAPGAAGRDLYLDASGNVVPGLSMNGPLAAGIPGEPAALAHIAARYGRIPLARSLAPAIRLAQTGFPVDRIYRDMTVFRLGVLKSQKTCAVRLLDNGEVPEPGKLIKQPELASTLRALADKGREGFYRGTVAQALVDAVRGAGGIWTLKDLENYRVAEREPVRGNYRGIRISSAAPPSSGGVVLVEMLNILSGFDLLNLSRTQQTHLLIESMRRAYRDRAEYLGDPDFVAMPLHRLLHPWYADGLQASIRKDRATPSSSLPGYGAQPEGKDTTHFSIIDGEGNRVAATLSINYPFGAAFCAAGVVLNDEMDDFAAKPGVPNAYGLVGAEANSIAPGKRPLSSMTPTFLETRDRVAVLGTPGGSRIITMVLQGVLAFDEQTPVREWVSRPRIHHQFLPDVVQYEPDALTPAQAEQLRTMGHVLKPQKRTWGNMQAVLWDRKNNRVDAASDPRGIGTAAVESLP